MEPTVSNVATDGVAQQELTSQSASEQEGERFSSSPALNSVTDAALNYIVERPTSQPLSQAGWRELVDPFVGEVGEMRSQFVSSAGDVTEAGAAATPKDDESALQEETMRQVTNLYLDLTHYQIAWKIAQKTQQDITQLLRGG